MSRNDYKFSEKRGFPFGIEWVAGQCGILGGKVKVVGEEIMLNCPNQNCPDKTLNFSLNTVTDTYNCWKCGEGGGMLDLYATLCCGGDRKAATRELYGRWENNTGVVPQRTYAKVTSSDNALSREDVPIEVKDLLYRYVLSVLEVNKIDLRRPDSERGVIDRGLTADAVLAYGYKSIERGSVIELPRHLEAYSKGVGGFYTYKGKRFVNTDCAGLLVPCRDLYGRIGSMQIMTRNGPKYLAFTSGFPNKGRTECSKAATCTPHHVGVDPNNVPKMVYFTEGLLKADIAHSLSLDGKPYISLAGVSNRRGLEGALKLLKDKGCETVSFVFDNDIWDSSKTVMKSVAQSAKLVREVGLKVKMVSFDRSVKGIDDYLLARHKLDIGAELVGDVFESNYRSAVDLLCSRKKR